MTLDGLISTIITSTAALVAIIGGFLVSRVIGMLSEQNSIYKQIADIRSKLQSNGRELREFQREIYDDGVRLFVLDKLEEKVIEGVPFESLIGIDDEWWYKRKNKKLLMEDFERFNKTEDELRERLKAYMLVDLPDNLAKFERDFLEGKEVLGKYRDWVEGIYDFLLYEKELKVHKEDNNAQKNPFEITMPSLPPNPPIYTSSNVGDIRRRLLDKKNRIKSDFLNLQIQLTNQVHLLDLIARPKGMWFGLSVLLYACITGIGYPITLIPFDVENYDVMRTKWLLIGLFLSALFFLIIYLGVSMYQLTKDKGIPRDIFKGK